MGDLGESLVEIREELRSDMASSWRPSWCRSSVIVSIVFSESTPIESRRRAGREKMEVMDMLARLNIFVVLSFGDGCCRSFG